MQSYNLIQPWEKGASSTRIGLGAVLPGGKVLVTAQMVTDATYIELEKPDTAAKTTAQVITVDYEANLALLKPINDNDFLSDRLPFELDTNLSPKDKVEAWQFEASGTPVTTQIMVRSNTVPEASRSQLPKTISWQVFLSVIQVRIKYQTSYPLQSLNIF